MVIKGLYVLYLFCFNRKYTNTRIRGDMKKSIILIITLVLLNACAEYSALVGPSYTMAKSGSIMQTGTAYATSYGIKKTTGQSPGEYIQTLVRKNYKRNSLLNQKESVTDCQKMQTSSLNKIFFETLDQISCLRDPFSILK